MTTQSLQERIDALSPKSDYMAMVEVTMGMAKGAKITVELTAEEIAAVLDAYDHGIDRMDSARKIDLDGVLGVLKRELWP